MHRWRLKLSIGLIIGLCGVIICIIAPGPIDGCYVESAWTSLTPGAEAKYCFEKGLVVSIRGETVFHLGKYEKHDAKWIWCLDDKTEIQIIPKLLFALVKDQNGRTSFLGFRIPIRKVSDNTVGVRPSPSTE
jgi:hypothetical protein